MPKTLNRTAELHRLRERYGRRNKEGKARLLDEFCEQHGYSRKHAIKLLGEALPQPKGQSPPGPEPKYLPVREVLETVWQHAEPLCGKRLVASGELNRQTATQMREQFAALVPFALAQSVNQRLKKILN